MATKSSFQLKRFIMIYRLIIEQEKKKIFDVCRFVHASVHVYARNLFLIFRYRQQWDRDKYLKIRLTNVEEDAGNEIEIIELSGHILDILRQIELVLPIPLVGSSLY